MSESGSRCDRCSNSFSEAPAYMNLVGGSQSEHDPAFRLCPHCARSLARWFERGGRTGRRRHSEGQEGAERSSSRPAKRRKKREEGVPKKQLLALYALLIVGTLAIFLFLIRNLNRPMPE